MPSKTPNKSPPKPPNFQNLPPPTHPPPHPPLPPTTTTDPHTLAAAKTFLKTLSTADLAKIADLTKSTSYTTPDEDPTPIPIPSPIPQPPIKNITTTPQPLSTPITTAPTATTTTSKILASQSAKQNKLLASLAALSPHDRSEATTWKTRKLTAELRYLQNVETPVMVLEAEGVMVGAEDLVGEGGREKYGAGEGNVLREVLEERRYRRAMEVYWWSKLLPEHMPGGGGGGVGGEASAGMSAWSQRGRGGVGPMMGMRVGKVEFARVCAMLLKEERRM